MATKVGKKRKSYRSKKLSQQSFENQPESLTFRTVPLETFTKRSSVEPDRLIIEGIILTSNPLPDRLFDQLPIDVQERIRNLYPQLNRANPKRLYDELQDLVNQYPDIVQIHNYLYIVYSRMRRDAEAKCVLAEVRQRFPDYFYGFIMAADECFNDGQPEKVIDIFGGSFDLKRLFPKRKVFHVVEVLSFQSVVSVYYYEMGDQVKADQAYGVMCQIDSKHQFTQVTKKHIYPSRFWLWIRSKLNFCVKNTLLLSLLQNLASKRIFPH